MTDRKKPFAFLYKHELRLEVRRQTTRKWALIYMLSLEAMAMVALAIWGSREGFRPEYLLYVCFAFPFMVYGISYRMIQREWSNNTYGWWLSLPYSRVKLVMAKYAAALTQSLVFLGLFFAAIFVLELFQLALHGGGSHLAGFFESIGQFALVLLITTPLMLALGMLASAIGRTKMKALMPLVWVFFGLVGNAMNWVFAIDPDSGDGIVRNHNGSVPLWLWLLIPVVWLGAALMIAATVKVCKKHLVL